MIIDYFESLVAQQQLHTGTNLITIINNGKGVIRLLQPADGLEILFWDLQLEQHIDYKKTSATNPADKSFLFIYSLTPEYFRVKKNKTATGDSSANILLASSDTELTCTVLPGSPVKTIMICANNDWIQKEYKNAEPELLFLLHDLQMHKQSFLFEVAATLSMHHHMADIHESIARDPEDMANIKTKSSLVLFEFLNILVSQNKHETSKKNITIYSNMMEVEKILDEHLEKRLPSIKVIAKTMALSESTLKRNFKQTFGVSIYERYLQKKMQVALKLFEEKDIPVKEVAHQLGYEKVSNFIKIFKKHHHCSPGTLRKKNTE